MRGVLADIDDTLTTDGRLTAAAYAALARLHEAGFVVVPITGRPAGWCDHIARMWPVSGVVGENGALWMRHDPATRRLVRRFVATDAERAAHRARLEGVGARILAAVPGTAFGLNDGCYLRVSYGAPDRETVAEGISRLVKGLRAIV